MQNFAKSQNLIVVKDINLKITKLFVSQKFHAIQYLIFKILEGFGTCLSFELKSSLHELPLVSRNVHTEHTSTATYNLQHFL